jgi:hypothetical protein
MRRAASIVLIAGAVLLLGSSASLAQDREGTTFGLGFQYSYPFWGLSGLADVANNVSIQGIFGLFGDLKAYAGRGIYRFNKKPKWNTYGYGMVGAWSYTGLDIRTLEETTETSFGFGAGLGVEWDLRAWVSDFPPLWWNFGIGIGSVEFDTVDYDFAAFSVGVGLHYRL